MGKIFINGLEFYAFHGYFKEEQKIGGKYRVDIELEADFEQAVESDELEGTINYAEVSEVVRREMQIKSKLIEHVAGRIIDSIFSVFTRVEYCRVKLTKMNPPMGLKIHSVSVELEKSRSGE